MPSPNIKLKQCKARLHIEKCKCIKYFKYSKFIIFQRPQIAQCNTTLWVFPIGNPCHNSGWIKRLLIDQIFLGFTYIVSISTRSMWHLMPPLKIWYFSTFIVKDIEFWNGSLADNCKFSALDHLTSVRYMNSGPSHFMQSMNENSKHSQI